MLRITLAALFFAAGLSAQTITGTIVTNLGVPVANVTLEFSNGAVPLTPLTNALGQFSCTVPVGTYDITMVPSDNTLAPRQFLGVVLGVVNMGTIVLQPGIALSGTVMAGGLPLSGADINVYDAVTGVKLFIQNDSTSALGTYTVIVPAGAFNVRGAPPAGLILVAQMFSNISVFATTTLPTMTLPAGVVLSGNVRHSITNAALVDVDIDVDNYFTGVRVQTPSDNTDSLGNFSVIVPVGVFNITLDPPPTMALLARQFFGIPVGGTTNAGVLTLQPGFTITGTVVGALSAPQSACNLDVDTYPGGFRMYTANDSTTATGTFIMVVPAGTYTLAVHAPIGSTYVGTRTASFVVGANTNLGTITLQQGVLFSGAVTNWFGLPEQDCDIDVYSPTTLAELVLTGDATSANGSYSVRVPQGTWGVLFKSRKTSLVADSTYASVSIGAGGGVLSPVLGLKQIMVYLDGASPSMIIPQGGSVPVIAAIYVPGGLSPTTGSLQLYLMDPNGVETPLYAPLPLSLPAQFFAMWQGLPLPLAPVNAAFLGKQFKLKARISNGAAVNPVIYDSDEFSFTIQ